MQSPQQHEAPSTQPLATPSQVPSLQLPPPCAQPQPCRGEARDPSAGGGGGGVTVGSVSTKGLKLLDRPAQNETYHGNVKLAIHITNGHVTGKNKCSFWGNCNHRVRNGRRACSETGVQGCEHGHDEDTQEAGAQGGKLTYPEDGVCRDVCSKLLLKFCLHVNLRQHPLRREKHVVSRQRGGNIDS
jgi:hypothetical protein